MTISSNSVPGSFQLTTSSIWDGNQDNGTEVTTAQDDDGGTKHVTSGVRSLVSDWPSCRHGRTRPWTCVDKAFEGVVTNQTFLVGVCEFLGTSHIEGHMIDALSDNHNVTVSVHCSCHEHTRMYQNTTRNAEGNPRIHSPIRTKNHNFFHRFDTFY